MRAIRDSSNLFIYLGSLHASQVDRVVSSHDYFVVQKEEYEELSQNDQFYVILNKKLKEIREKLGVE